MNNIGGVEFLHGTGNHAICGVVVFRCYDISFRHRTYRLYMDPDSWLIEQKNGREWNDLNKPIHKEDVVALLPKDCGLNWTWELFYIAFTAYGYGVEDGAARGGSD
jgi:hypothetical protein